MSLVSPKFFQSNGYLDAVRRLGGIQIDVGLLLGHDGFDVTFQTTMKTTISRREQCRESARSKYFKVQECL